MIEEMVGFAFENAMYNQQSTIEEVTADGRLMKAEIDSEDLRDAIEWQARQSTVDDPDSPGDEIVSIIWKDQHGNDSPDRVRYSYICNKLGIAPEDFEVYVLKMERGHDSTLGHTENTQAETIFGMDTWTTDGVYEADPSLTHRTLVSDMNFGVNFVTIFPLIDTDLLRERDEDIEFYGE